MKYASILKAELGWKVVLSDFGGYPRLHEVRSWGVQFEDGKLVPLDFEEESLYRSNFVMLINPNNELPTWNEILSKTKEHKVQQSLEKSGT